MLCRLPYIQEAKASHSRVFRLALRFEGGVRNLARLVAPIAERFVRRGAATAKRKCRFACQVVLLAIGIDQLDRSGWIIHPKWPVRPHRNRDLSH